MNNSRRLQHRDGKEFVLLTQAISNYLDNGVPLPAQYRKYPSIIIQQIITEKMRVKKSIMNGNYWKDQPTLVTNCRKCNKLAYQNSKGKFLCGHCRFVTIETSKKYIFKEGDVFKKEKPNKISERKVFFLKVYNEWLNEHDGVPPTKSQIAKKMDVARNSIVQMTLNLEKYGYTFTWSKFKH